MGENRYLSLNTEEVASKVLDGEAIMINLTTGVYYSMDGVGANTLDLVERGLSTSSIVQTISDWYDVPQDRVQFDVEQLVNQLLEERLVTESSEAPSEAGAPSGAPSADRPYVAPMLNRYDDMQDLLALDPPIPGLRNLG